MVRLGYEPEVSSFFGQPRGIKTGGVVFDIPLIQYVANKDGDAEKARQFTLQVGTLSSALEHITPEQMFAPTDPTQPKPDAISAVKALQKASAAGQKIYQVNQANMGQILPLLGHDQTTLNEIRTALNAGKDVTTHTSAVSIPGGWSGFGYIITDPMVGDGVYKISGGLNGGFIVAFIITVLAFFAVYTLVLGGFFWAAGALFAWEAFNVIGWVRNIRNANSFDEFNKANISQSLIGAAGLLLAPGIGFEAAATLFVGIIFSWMLTSF